SPARALRPIFDLNALRGKLVAYAVRFREVLFLARRVARGDQPFDLLPVYMGSRPPACKPGLGVHFENTEKPPRADQLRLEQRLGAGVRFRIRALGDGE